MSDSCEPADRHRSTRGESEGRRAPEPVSETCGDGSCLSGTVGRRAEDFTRLGEMLSGNVQEVRLAEVSVQAGGQGLGFRRCRIVRGRRSCPCRRAVGEFRDERSALAGQRRRGQLLGLSGGSRSLDRALWSVVLYEALAIGLSGQTRGKRVSGIKVVNRHGGGGPSAERALVRAVRVRGGWCDRFDSCGGSCPDGGESGRAGAVVAGACVVVVGHRRPRLARQGRGRHRPHYPPKIRLSHTGPHFWDPMPAPAPANRRHAVTRVSRGALWRTTC